MEQLLKDMIEDKKNYDYSGKFKLEIDVEYGLIFHISQPHKKHLQYVLRVYTKDCNCGENNIFRTHFYTTGNLREVLSTGYELFQKKFLYYSKLTDDFYLTEEELKYNEKHIENIKKYTNTPIEKCSVCLDNCETKLRRCGHFLCSPCLRKLHKKKYCCLCPICREGIFHENTESDEEVDDESDEESNEELDIELPSDDDDE